MGCLSWKYQILCLLSLFFHSTPSSLSSSLSSISQCSALLHFNHSLSLHRDASPPFDTSYSTGYISNIHMCDNSYPKTASWKEDTDCCTWDGVVCHKTTRHVIGLDLSCSWLNGSINSNSTLFFLPHLKRLNLAGNFFNYSLISSEFGKFESLTHLNLSLSTFSGKIPHEISHLSSLVSLDLSLNDGLLIETPVWKRVIHNLTQLRELLLDEMNMSSIRPNSLMNLSSSLTTLSLYDCNLQGKLQNNILSLMSIQTLDLGFNLNLEGSLLKCNWSNSLKSLSLSMTKFSGKLPDSIGNLKSLKVLALDNCNFTGSIPTSLGNLTQITYLYLHANRFTGSIPTSLGNLTKLTSLALSLNGFSGLLPLSLLNLPNLSTLYLGYNQLVGPLPNHVSGLLNLNKLFLSSNFLNGTLPSWLFNLPYLVWLNLEDNQFIGEIGDNLLQGPFPTLSFLSMQYLFVSKNKLTGEIPSLICNASYLDVLDLSHNNLSGIIPKCLAHSKSLTVLDLRMNSLHGTIPATFSTGNSFRNINFNGNQLEGLLPRSLANCRNLEVLDLGSNKINGIFPYWLEGLSNLRVLVLRSNKFQGRIGNPKNKSPFPNLRILDISNNEFNGPLPIKYFKYLKAMTNVEEGKVALKYMGDWYYQDSMNVMMKGSYIEMVRIQTVFTTIDFSNNSFRGEMPKIIGRLKSLKGLNFSHNNLTGYIPSSFGNLSNLEWLDLSFNKLIGEIPRQLADLTWLEVLKLSHNQLTGHIPSGKQFNTFDNDSYTENLGLCGFPLSRMCHNHEARKPPPLTLQKKDNLELENGFGWQAVSIGYGCGVIFGMLMGYLMFKIGKPRCIVRMVMLEQHILLRRLKKNAQRRGGKNN